MTRRFDWHLLPVPTSTATGSSRTAGLWPLPVAVRLIWTARDPRGVRVSFRTGAQPVVWTVGRDLLTAGLLAPTGLGDVTVLPDPSDPALGELVLSSPSGRACFRFLTAPVADYLHRLPEPPEISPVVASLIRAVAGHDGIGEAA